MTTIRVDELKDAIGTDLGASRWILIDQARVDRFADSTEDRQWIHVDPERAAAGPFGGPIAHGYLTLSLASAGVAELLTVTEVDMMVNYGLGKVRFPAPVPVGSHVRVRGVLAEVTSLPGASHATIELTFECDQAPKPVCVAEMIIRYVPTADAL